MEIIELFSTCSGLSVNFDKTQAVWIRAKRELWRGVKY
jgi:hypothetical protein